MADGIAFEGAPKNESVVAEAKNLRARRFLQASRMFGRKALHALIDALLIYAPVALGANVGGVPGLFIGAWLGAQLIKSLDASPAKETKETSAQIRGNRLGEAIKMFGVKTANALSDAGAAAIPPMIGALVGSIIPVPGATEAGALIGAWLSARWLRKIRAKREK